LNEAFKELDEAFDRIIEEIEHPERSYPPITLFTNLRGEKTEYADYAKVVYTIVVRVADDNMSASISVISTASKIRRYTIEELNRAIHAQGVVYGIDSNILMRMVSRQVFNRDIIFAKGVLPVDGENGYIEHLFDFKEKKSYEITAQTPICRIVPATSGNPGYDVFGKMLTPVHGKNALPPVGEKTMLNADRTSIVAETGGSLSFKNGKYAICDESYINENITREHGKIHFPGNLIINGNVGEDSIISSDRSITIRGKVNGAVIEAKGDLTIEYAVKKSVLTSGGDMLLMSASESVVNCGGDLDCASLNQCETKCTGKLNCTINQGNINGGSTAAIGTIVCITAGSRLHEKTVISVGDCSDFVAERAMVMRTLNRIETDIEKIDRRISKLKIQKRDLGFLSHEDSDFLVAAVRIRKQKEEEKIPLNERISRLDEIINSAENSEFKTQRSLHSNVSLNIRGRHRNIDSEFGKITAYASNYGVVIS